MDQDLFTNLPSEILVDILLRLSPDTILTCKCVCKSWLDLIESELRMPLALVVSHLSYINEISSVFSNWKISTRGDLITEFNFPQASRIPGYANGLLLILKDDHKHLYVCNPFTREFVELHRPPTCPGWGDYYGFGVSRIRGQYKVVCHNGKTGFHVYDLEAGSSWRGVEAANPSFDRCYTSVGAYVSGNLHWLVSNERGIPYVCCFDLETERFSTFSIPPQCIEIKGRLGTLGDYLCFYNDEASYNSSIWLLKEYEQVKKCWIKVMKVPDFHLDDGFFHKKTAKSSKVSKVNSFGAIINHCFEISKIRLTPNFLPLKRLLLGMENIISF